MRFHLQRAATRLPLVLLWTSALFATAGPREKLNLDVIVINAARVPMTVLRRGELETERIFLAAGIEVKWTDCSPGAGQKTTCRNTASSQTLVLQIVASGKTQTDSVYGEAFLGENGRGKYCDIFFQRIEQATQVSVLNPSRLLGTVMAHELGHLLLGSQTHSYWGVMKPLWTGENLHEISKGTLLFSSQQARLIKTRLNEPGNDNTAEVAATSH